MEDKKEKSKSGMVLIVVLLLIAICGVGFGVFEMMQVSEKNNKIAELEKKQSNSSKDNNKIAELEKKQSNSSKDNNVVDNNSQDENNSSASLSTGGPYIKDNYFYVPEWNYKFKIPEDITSVGFSVDYDEAHVGYDLPFIGFTGVLKSDIHYAQAQYYDDILNCSIISVNRTIKGKNNYTLGDYDKEIDGYVLRISDFQSSYCNFNLHKAEVFNKLKNMFQNPEKIN